MPAVVRHCSRIDTFELKVQIERRLGSQKAEKYFNLLTRYLSHKLSKSEFDKVCIGLIGRENISLHNELIRAIVKNASISKTPPPIHGKIDVKAHQINGLQSLCKDVFPQSPKKGRTPNVRERKFRALHEKSNNVAFQDLATKKVQEQQSATELLSLGSKPPVEVNSVEEGEEVEQAAISPGIYSRSPVRAPFGITIHSKETRKVLCNGHTTGQYTQTCYYSGGLPDTNSLENRLKQKLRMEGLETSMDCVNLLNNGLDVFLKRVMKPCLELAGARSQHKAPQINGMMRHVLKPNRSFSASMLDFRVAMESNPRILGEDWPVQLERICLFSSEQSIGTDHGSKFMSN